jgi:hypothetical protein
VRRADIETFARELEARGRARATVTRRLCTIAGFYRYAVEEELLDHSPAAHVRRPRVDYESHAVALDRNELGALPGLLKQAGITAATPDRGTRPASPRHRRSWRSARGCSPGPGRPSGQVRGNAASARARLAVAACMVAGPAPAGQRRGAGSTA